MTLHEDSKKNGTRHIGLALHKPSMGKCFRPLLACLLDAYFENKIALYTASKYDWLSQSMLLYTLMIMHNMQLCESAATGMDALGEAISSSIHCS